LPDTVSTELTAPIWKDEDRRIVYGVVLQPDVVDSQGDRVSAEEIEKAAHRFLVESRKSDVQHSEQPANVDVIESFVAPHEMVVAGQPVLKGAWVMATHIGDDRIWEQVKKGELTGYSIGGTASRIPVGA